MAFEVATTASKVMNSAANIKHDFEAIEVVSWITTQLRTAVKGSALADALEQVSPAAAVLFVGGHRVGMLPREAGRGRPGAVVDSVVVAHRGRAGGGRGSGGTGRGNAAAVARRRGW